MAKAKAKQLTSDDYQSLLFERGIYDPAYLQECAENKSLDFLQSGWQSQFDQAVEYALSGKIDKIDGLFDELFFTTCKQITAKVGDDFMKGYLKTLIDLHNLKSKLRLLNNPSIGFKPDFIDGGNLEASHMETVEDILSQFAQFGGADFWKEAIDYYQSSGNTTSLDARSSEYMLMYAKEASYDMFSSASLVLYYLKCRQAAANIRIIVVGKDSGMRDSAIRPNLRMAYVSE
jgi:vacuolar-type H+-ATPase subunit C/Vma6